MRSCSAAALALSRSRDAIAATSTLEACCIAGITFVVAIFATPSTPHWIFFMNRFYIVAEAFLTGGVRKPDSRATSKSVRLLLRQLPLQMLQVGDRFLHFFPLLVHHRAAFSRNIRIDDVLIVRPRGVFSRLARREDRSPAPQGRHRFQFHPSPMERRADRAGFSRRATELVDFRLQRLHESRALLGISLQHGLDSRILHQ